MKWVIEKMVGTHTQRLLKRLTPVVERINQLEPQMQALSDEQLRAKTDEFRQRFRQALAGETLVEPHSAPWYELNFDQRQQVRKQRRAVQQRTLEQILPEAFAVVREAGRRVLGMRHFDVQLLGGMMLHDGRIAEMATGEGKTLVATLPAYLNALTGRGVHVVTVNDYLARRDTRWMGPLYHALGLRVGVIQGVDPAERRMGDRSLSFIYDPTVTDAPDRFIHLRPVERREAYQADITYGQNNEFGFDYLRDNMRFRNTALPQGEFHYAIVDEVDSILVDEARTPLIISGPAEESTELYHRLDQVVRKLTKGDHFEIDEKQHAVSLTEAGIQRCEELLAVENLYDEQHMRLVHHVNQALRAHELFKRDVDYMIQSEDVIIVDEFTGRLMPGRRWSDGLHQAIEAKEGVRIREENQTLASVTFQNYFRMYEKLAGMTGTASTEAEEFQKIYQLDVVSVPPNRTLTRVNHPDVVFKTEAEKFVAVAQEIVELHQKGQPVLVGTISIEKSERLSRWLKEPAPFLQRMATVCQWMAGELPKESLSEALTQRLSKLAARPAMVTSAEAQELLEQVTREAPKSVLIYRLEMLVAMARVVEAVRAGIPHSVLNAKYHEHEARIVAQAGRLGAVTIATNMAGRGTDILLGGNPQAMVEDALRELRTKNETPTDEQVRELSARFKAQTDEEHDKVVAAGGLHVLGTERHEARRIDNQLRGRSGRQGDPGSSRFYLSLEDDLMRIFGSDRVAKLMDLKWFQWEEGLPIEHGLLTRSIETAQRRVEGQNFESRKHLLEYDNVMNRQREVIYEQRRRVLEGVELARFVDALVDEVADEIVAVTMPKELRPDQWDLSAMRTVMARQFAVELGELDSADREAWAAHIAERLRAAYAAKTQALGEPIMRQLERNILLAVMDAKWKDHLYMMDALRDGIGLRAYGQRDPLVEYQHEAYEMFRGMIESVKAESLALLLRIRPAAEAQPVSVFANTPQQETHPEAARAVDAAAATQHAAAIETPPVQPQTPPAPVRRPVAPSPIPGRPADPFAVPAPAPQVRAASKVGRNDPCPCGSGVKYKKCHGK
jgi:preprotein translocase subunit SecA